MLRGQSTRILGVLTVMALTLLGPHTTPAQTKADGKTDANGDPLPAGALARMGTLRWRHTDTINYVAYTPDGKAVLTAGQDNLIKLWDRASGKAIRQFTLPSPEPAAQPQPGRMILMAGASGFAKVALSEDGKLVAAVLTNNAIQLWNVQTGKTIRQLEGPKFGVNTLVFSPDGKAIALRGGDRTTAVLDIDTGKEICQIKAPQPKAKGGPIIINFGGGGGGGSAGGVAFSRDGKTIATTEVLLNNQKTATSVKFTDVNTGKEIRQIDTGARAGVAVAYSPDRKVFAYANGKDVHFLDAADTAKEIRQVSLPVAIRAIGFAPDGKTLAAKGGDQIIRLIETATGKIGPEFGGAPPLPPAGNGGAFIVVGGFGGGPPEPRDFAFSHDGKVIATAFGPALRFFTAATGKEQALAGGHRGAVSNVVLSTDGKTLVSRAQDGTIRRWDAKNGQELSQFTEPKGTVAVAFAPDGKTAALASADGGVRLVDTVDGKELHRFKSHQNGVADLAFSADGAKLASRGALDRTIRIHDVSKGTELKEIALPAPPNQGNAGFVFGGGLGGAGAQGVVFSPDGQTIAAHVNIQPGNAPGGQPFPAGANSMLVLWDTTSGKPRRQIVLPAGRTAGTLAFSPDGRLLASENTDQTISLCEIASGRERALLGKPASGGQPNQQFMGANVFIIGNGGRRAANVLYTTLAFSPDGTLLISRGPEHAVRVWEVAHAKQLALFKGHAADVRTLSIAPDGKTVASGSADTTLLVWDLTTVKRTQPGPTTLKPKQLESLWADLIGDDAVKAGQSITALASAPAQTVAFLKERLKPAAPIDAKKVEKLVADLDSGNFVTRTKATAELEKLGELAAPALKKALASDPTVETRRRIEPILDKVTSGEMTAERLRLVRAVEVLERLGTPAAKEVLQALAQGAPGALPTRQAQAALDHLNRKAAP